MTQSLRFEIRGLVQGVGFRPFVYKLAKKYHLLGFVFNTGNGVMIEVEGSSDDMKLFSVGLHSNPPSLARIDTIEIHEQNVKHFEVFEILESHHRAKTTSIPPDIAVCDECLSEMKDPHNRRFGYYLTNCTNCGPRYSIIETLPYDRVMTSMKAFNMCNHCQAEYDDPANRRYHAQPISCHECGPVLSMLDCELNIIAQGSGVLEKAAEYLKNGKIIALKGIGGFHLLCDATNEQAVSALRMRKKRPKKPFAVMFCSLNQLSEYLCADEMESAWLISKERPIVLVKKRSGNDALLAQSVAPDIDTIGAMVAYAPIHHLLFDCFTSPLVATSANHSDEPIVRDIHELRDKLGSVVDVIVDFNRDIVNTVDDSILQVIQNRSSMLRLGRGYTPYTLKYTTCTPLKILAVGGQQKNTIGLAFEDKLILSPHIGDLYSIEGMDYFERTVDTFKRFYDFSPDVIVCDKHPNYATALWAKNQGVRVITVQHHYAHALACMAEFGLESQVLAFCFDGTGYGDDGNIWGGEIFIADPTHCERIGYLNPFRLLGGEKAIKEPKRVALALLFEIYSLEEVHDFDLPLLAHFSPEEINSYYKIWKKQINSPLCTSMGRVFDAMASFCDVIHEKCYEG
ncbi:MAG TPA: carbamoyltransferase HypF, partial [Sulfuricurvum sp.]|nr:carbamoyltransferase HypF [Sulfuricurvum sp.]